MDKVNVPAEEGLSNTPADNTTPGAPERPEWLPEKFNSPEDMAKSYKELEKKLGTGKPDLDDQFDNPDLAKGDEPPSESTDDDLSEETPSPHNLPGVETERAQEISNYAWENGELADEHYADLEKAGYSRDIVDQFMAGQFAQAEAQESQLINAGGGQEQVEHMFGWARDNLSEDQIQTYDAKFNAGGPDAIMAMEHLKARFDASGPSSSIKAANAPATETNVYRSVAQMQQDMADPRYKSDPAFRASVERKLGRSNIL